MNPFKSKTPIQIRFKDIDKLGHVNNANHITYFELARMDYFDAIADEHVKIDWVNEGVILAKMEMEYKQPILLEDKIFVYTWVSRIGSKSFDMACSIVRDVNGTETEMAKGLAIVVCFNYSSNQSIAIPEMWKAKMVAGS
ncbi:MAG: Thioesterase superfamily protein [Bacteroidetes bacterium]|nr:Thioesterase superfamily protein [Bacteroidota bacterium]